MHPGHKLRNPRALLVPTLVPCDGMTFEVKAHPACTNPGAFWQHAFWLQGVLPLVMHAFALQ